MNPGNAQIVFEIAGREYVYDGALPLDLLERCAHLLDAQGFWRYPPELAAQAKEPRDMLPFACWEIAAAGGRVIRIEGARASGAILEEDWKHPRIY
jgi:hypothetical protein